MRGYHFYFYINQFKFTSFVFLHQINTVFLEYFLPHKHVSAPLIFYIIVLKFLDYSEYFASVSQESTKILFHKHNKFLTRILGNKILSKYFLILYLFSWKIFCVGTNKTTNQQHIMMHMLTNNCKINCYFKILLCNNFAYK